jgi:hypothetical protein
VTATSCSHCDSADVRPSRHSRDLGSVGLHAYRCRACGGLFWLPQGRIEAVRVRWDKYFASPLGAAPREASATPLPTSLAGLGPAPVALGALDQPPDAPARETDLRALDTDLARRRSEVPPR